MEDISAVLCKPEVLIDFTGIWCMVRQYIPDISWTLWICELVLV